MQTTANRLEIATVPITCCACGLTFTVPEVWEQGRRQKHDTFYCPNGHSLSFSGETPQEKRIRELEEYAKRTHALAEQHLADFRIEHAARKSVERRLSATRGVLTRTRNRIAAGVCPCCNRTFKQLARHMAAKHPEYSGEPDPVGG